jgi:CheY-like chemotaxis protein
MKKILVVSLSRTFLKRKTNLLRQRGLHLFIATSGAEALKMHAEHHFDLIFIDLQLEDMGGYTLCSLVRRQEKDRHTPIILICLRIQSSIERAEQSGASAVLLRPIESVHLMETIGGFLDMQMIRNRRVMLNAKVLIRTAEQEFFCLSHDISNTGMLVKSGCQLEFSQRLVCRFTLPGSCRIETAAEVTRYVQNCGNETLYGLKFIDLPLADSRAIDSYVTSLAHTTAGTIDRPLDAPPQHFPPEEGQHATINPEIDAGLVDGIPLAEG